MKRELSMIVLAAAALLGGCTATGSGGGSVGDYAIGDDSAAIKKGRNRASAQISRAELEQHRRQRANASEELDLEAKKRHNKRDEIDGTLGTANKGVDLIRDIRYLRWGW